MTDTLTPVPAAMKELSWKKPLPEASVGSLSEGAQLQ